MCCPNAGHANWHLQPGSGWPVDKGCIHTPEHGVSRRGEDLTITYSETIMNQLRHNVFIQNILNIHDRLTNVLMLGIEYGNLEGVIRP
jgi:hypothetical protein